MANFDLRPVKELSTDRNLYVSIHWDYLAPGDSIPGGGMPMKILLFRDGTSLEYPLGVYGGWLWLPPSSSAVPLCYNYENMQYLDFIHKEDASLFEVRNSSAVYNTGADYPLDEPAVTESFPYTFYVSRENASFSVPARGYDTVHCYLRNVLHEFTFMVYGVDGAKNVGSSSGSISGVSASCFPASGALSGSTSTVIFRRALAIENGCAPEPVLSWHRSDSIQRVPCSDWGFIPVHPLWFPDGYMNRITGWRGDWIIGAFSVFGVPDGEDIRNVLTVECFSKAHYNYTASWGYWKGEWEETVRRQIMGALGYFDGIPSGIDKGSLEAQIAWRKHNGGFDIILYNDGRLVIPPDVGLNVKVPGWDGRTVPLN
jgi:hypothetical protein